MSNPEEQIRDILKNRIPLIPHEQQVFLTLTEELLPLVSKAEREARINELEALYVSVGDIEAPTLDTIRSVRKKIRERCEALRKES